mgnify:CR=1 FL=1
MSDSFDKPNHVWNEEVFHSCSNFLANHKTTDDPKKIYCMYHNTIFDHVYTMIMQAYEIYRVFDPSIKLFLGFDFLKVCGFNVCQKT